MESPIKSRTVVDIGQTVETNIGIVGDILAAHALTGCDTVACYYGIGKGTVVKMLREGYSLSFLGEIDAPGQEGIKQATSFMTDWYGQNGIKSMSDARWKMWASKTGQVSSSPPKTVLSPANQWRIRTKSEKSPSSDHCMAIFGGQQPTRSGSIVVWLEERCANKNPQASHPSS
ncbi:hypothetical protein HOLleu_32732 [Holothuria leucospilota]|uniref:Uncharacterized protein n=1 Tax=Holothuria leucospilota TaxID=206669 RepID=A0A9Q1BJB0_HOLLE|nr:hypothetical protein HOLleu_32732 [Holothuria leucospilota]